MILAFALPLMCFGQKENVKLGGDDRSRKGKTEEYDQQRANKMRQMEQRENQEEMMREMRDILSGPESFVYIELLVIQNGKEEEVMVNVDRSALESMHDDPVSARKLEGLSQSSFSSLSNALNELDKLGWSYVDSYSVGMKEPMLKVIMRMPRPGEKKKK